MRKWRDQGTISDQDREFIKAAEDGDTREVNRLLDQRANIDAQDENQWTALMEACVHGQTEVVRTLLARGADFSIKKTTDQSSALIWAAYEGREEIAELLINAGANVNDTNNQGLTVFDIAILRGHRDVALLLAAHRANSARIT